MGKKKDIFHKELGLKESERQARIKELQGNVDRQPADDKELDRLLNLPPQDIKEEDVKEDESIEEIDEEGNQNAEGDASIQPKLDGKKKAKK